MTGSDTTEALDKLEGADCPKEAIEDLQQVGRSHGFVFCLYAVCAPIPLNNGPVTVFASCSGQCQERSGSSDFFRNDPIVQEAMLHRRPVVWTANLIQDAPFLWDEVKLHGLQAGWSLAVWDASGATGLVSFVTAGSTPLPANLLDVEAHLVLASHAAHRTISQHWLRPHVPERANNLTNREIEVLRWTADGKTSYEISSIIGISTKTVNYHLYNGLAKLDAANRVQGVVKAALLGLIC